jgi:hypothetical protein
VRLPSRTGVPPLLAARTVSGVTTNGAADEAPQMDSAMPIIETHELIKEFRLPVKSPGFAGEVKHLFRPKHRQPGHCKEQTCKNHLLLS